MSDDLISRQAAIDLWDKYHHYIATKAIEYDRELRALPFAQPEPDPEWRKKHYEVAYAQGFVDGCKSYEKQLGQKRGQWKQGYCSECGYNWGKDAPVASVPNFCPNCGAIMKGESDG